MLDTLKSCCFTVFHTRIHTVFEFYILQNHLKGTSQLTFFGLGFIFQNWQKYCKINMYKLCILLFVVLRLPTISQYKIVFSLAYNFAVL